MMDSQTEALLMQKENERSQNERIFNNNREAFIKRQQQEIEKLNNIINRTTEYVESLSSKGRGCDIYEDIKQDILKELKGSDKE